MARLAHEQTSTTGSTGARFPAESRGGYAATGVFFPFCILLHSNLGKGGINKNKKVRNILYKHGSRCPHPM